MPFKIDTLANGLRLVTVEMPHLHSTEMICYAAVGARNETDQHAGISHFLEHMLFRGNSDYPTSLALEQAFESLGGMINAATDAETTYFHSRLHPDQLTRAPELFAALLRKPLWKEIDTERRIVLEEALDDLSETGEMINPDILPNRLFWPGHPLCRPTVGCTESIEAIGEAELHTFHKSFYTPANTVIAISGRLQRQAVLDAIENAFGDWTGKKAPAPEQAGLLPSEGRPQSVWVHDSSSQVSVQLAIQLPGRFGEDAFALRIWRRILSWGGSARLMLRLREELGLTYHVEANLNLLEDVGCLTIDLALQPANLKPAVEELLTMLQEIAVKGVKAEELASTRRNFNYDLDYSRDNTDELAVRYGWGELVGYRRGIEDDRRDIESLSAADLQQTARRILQPGRIALAVVGPWREEDRPVVEGMLQGFR